MYKPKLIIDVNAEQINRLKEKEREKEDKERARTRANDADDDNNQRAEVEIVELDDKEDVASLSDDDSDRGADIAPPSNHNTPSDHAEEEAPPPASPVVVVSKKKKLDVKDVFNADDDDSVHGGKRRKLVPLGKCFSEVFVLKFSKIFWIRNFFFNFYTNFYFWDIFFFEILENLLGLVFFLLKFF